MADSILVHNTGEVATLSQGTFDGPLCGHEMAQKDDLFMDKGTEILFSNGFVTAIESAGTLSSEWLGNSNVRDIDARGKAIVPAFVDSHTHLVWSGDRSDEITMRSRGLGYEEIGKLGGGIKRTVANTRRSTEEELRNLVKNRIDMAQRSGTGRLEAKSGYGLDVEHEKKSLEVLDYFNRNGSNQMECTWLGAHDIPTGFTRGQYLDNLLDEQLPMVTQNKLARYVDVFCEPGWFTTDETTLICEESKKMGLEVRLHVDEFVDSGGLDLATEIGAVSADHVARSPMPSRVEASESGTMQTFLPGTPYALGKPLDLPLKQCMDAGVSFSLATDFNPNCPSLSLPFVASLAVHRMKLDPVASLVAITRNPATSLDCSGTAHRGTIEVGIESRVLILETENYESFLSPFGTMNNFDMIN